MATGNTRARRYARRRRARVAQRVNDLTDEQWGTLRELWGGCAYCGAVDVAMQRDCVLAISRGGRYTMTNVVPCCRSCNASKCNSEVTTWMRRKKLDEKAFLVRHATINRDLRAGSPDQLPGESLDTEHP